jgi:hypothetical protein
MSLDTSTEPEIGHRINSADVMEVSRKSKAFVNDATRHKINSSQRKIIESRSKNAAASYSD